MADSEPAVATPASTRILLGDEAVAVGALDAGISAAYAYPGTPSTEILEYLIHRAEHGEPVVATWCTNEKTAFEQALGVSMVGRRVLVAMKHVGLNVAADPFVNSALLGLRGGVVLAVADDPGMHSSQNEQDSRFYADFARVICLEPATQQEAYDMTREAFDLSERLQVPIVLRLVTRLCHGRAEVRTGTRRPQNEFAHERDPASWILLPANARRRWRALLEQQGEFLAWSEASGFNRWSPSADDRGLGVVTAGRARNDYEENLPALGFTPSHVHVGAYPLPVDKLRALAAKVERIVVLEEGFPIVERALRGVLPSPLPIHGKEAAPGSAPILPPDGELTPALVREALGLAPLPKFGLPGLDLPARPPQLCQGCPHGDAFSAVKAVAAELTDTIVTADIGCYTLGALPPYQAIESCVCMGASIGMAKGAVDAGAKRVLAVIGDSTFLHSGITPLIDAAAADTNMTLLILDNRTVAMTGAQPTILNDIHLGPMIAGIGVDPEHLHVIEVHPKLRDQVAELIRREVEHPGLSVIVTVRECIESVRRRKEHERHEREEQEAGLAATAGGGQDA
jgi:indolepyruvate ferredoxin oxidoreductase alpha subunit